MYSFRRLALVLALGVPAAHVLLAQDTSTPSTPAPQQQTPSTSSSQDQSQPAAAPLSQGQLSVQARIRARREQRRAQAIQDTYGHLYDVFIGGGFLRYRPGPDLQRLNFFSWDTAITRYFNDKLGVTVDGRGYYGTAYVGLSPGSQASTTRPAISEYAVMGGPTYRFFLRPKYSLAVRGMGGAAYSNFNGDTNGIPPASLGLYPDGTRFAVDGGIIGETNVSPNLSLRLAGDYYGTGFGGQLQNSFGFTYGFVYRFGKQ
ncbi:MAG TPA: hypothetical protein VK716_16795 [Terracidiphilus sp.]|jgi:hypothetical protein|nr:hypothetical protein [Terracidiphilus sp.]